MAGEVMWDAILASVPQDPPFIPPQAVAVPPDRLSRYVGTYEFGPHIWLQVTVQDGALHAMALVQPVFEFGSGALVSLLPTSATDFYVAGRYHTRLSFIQGADGHAIGATLNPGRWAQTGKRSSD